MEIMFIELGVGNVGFIRGFSVEFLLVLGKLLIFFEFVFYYKIVAYFFLFLVLLYFIKMYRD